MHGGFAGSRPSRGPPGASRGLQGPQGAPGPLLTEAEISRGWSAALGHPPWGGGGVRSGQGSDMSAK